MRQFVLYTFLFILTACTGWHLKGLVTLPEVLQPIAVEPKDSYSPLQKEFLQILRDSHIALSDEHHPAQITVTLESESFSTSPYTIGVDGQVKENKLTYQLNYRADDAHGNPLIATNTLTLTRVIPFNNNHILSTNSDTQIQQSQLRVEALNQLMLRLSKAANTAVVKPAPSKK